MYPASLAAGAPVTVTVPEKWLPTGSVRVPACMRSRNEDEGGF